MENPQIRPGLVTNTEPMPRVVAFFRNSASGNLAIQLLTALGVPNDRLGVTPPEQIEHGQGMLLSIACPDESWLAAGRGGLPAERRRDPPPTPLTDARPPPRIPTDARPDRPDRCLALPGLAAAGRRRTARTSRRSPATCPRSRRASRSSTFNGKDLTGFYAYTKDHKYDDPNKVFTVKDGMIRVSGEEFGGLATCGNFADYHLVVEWKWGEQTWAPREGQGARLGHPAPLRRARRRGGRAVDGVDRVPDHRRGLRRLPHGRRPGQAEPDLRDPGRPRRAALLSRRAASPSPATRGRFNWWGRDPAWKDVLGFRGPRRRREAGRRVEPDGGRLRRRHDHQHRQRRTSSTSARSRA